MLYTTAARLEGNLLAPLYARFCGLVSERCEELTRLIRERLPGLEVTFVRPLAALRELVEDPPDDVSATELANILRKQLAGTSEAERIFGPVFRSSANDLGSLSYRGYVMGYLQAALSVPSRALLVVESNHEERIMTVLDDRRSGLVKEVKAQGLCVKSLYRFDTLACLKDPVDVTLRVVPPPVAHGMLCPTLPSTLITANLPQMRPLFFADRSAAPGLMQALEAGRSVS
jgi:hypothetical protein